MQINIAVAGTAFRAMETSLPDVAKRLSDKSETKIAEQKQQVTGEAQIKITFRDPVSAEDVSVYLTHDNFDLLRAHFDKNDFSEYGDSIALSGVAEKLVSGWYGDIAYNRNFLKADSNGDGLLDKTEYQNTKNSFSVKKHAEIDTNSGFVKITNEIESGYSNSLDAGDEQPKSISEELNSTISIDKNLDGSFELREFFESQNKGASAESFVLKEFRAATTQSQIAKTALNKIGFFNNAITNHTIEKFLSKKDDDDKPDMQSIIKKLIAANGNEAVLSTEERQILGGAINAVKERVGKELDTNNLLDVRA